MQILWLAVVPLALTATALGGSMEKRPARQDIAILRRATESLSSTTKRKNIGGAGAASLRIQPLPYPTDALEPAISKAIMELHHDKHLQGYITAYNEAVGKHAAVGSSDLGAQLALAKTLNFNAGGIANHILFFNNLAPPKSAATKVSADSVFEKMVKQQYGSFAKLEVAVNKTAAALQGAGWVWVGYNTVSKALEVSSTANQDTLLTAEPILAIDIWEHAYYLQYKNLKFAYLKAIWPIMNLQQAEQRLKAAMAKPPMRR